MKKIYFDMDGTVADLYGEPNWLEDLNRYSPRPYKYAKPLVDMDELEEICKELISRGYDIGIITWLSKGGNPEYDKRVIKAKVKWAKKYMPYVKEFKAQSFGTPKQKAVKRAQRMILIDDNAEVRKMWNTPKQRISINANEDFLQALKELL